MPWIAHRRRGSKFGHHPFAFALVTPPLLPLALSTSSPRHSFVLTLRLPSRFAHPFDSLKNLDRYRWRHRRFAMTGYSRRSFILRRQLCSHPDHSCASRQPTSDSLHPKARRRHGLPCALAPLLYLRARRLHRRPSSAWSRSCHRRGPTTPSPIVSACGPSAARPKTHWFFPKCESSSASASSPASASSRSAPGRNGPSSASSMPLIHQRRQHIISNTPDATNPVQTILQPDIPHPPLLTKTLPVPSMVRMAPMRQHAPTLTAPTLSAIVRPAAPPTPAPAPQPTLPKIQPATVDTVPLTSATRTRRFTQDPCLRRNRSYVPASKAAHPAARSR